MSSFVEYTLASEENAASYNAAAKKLIADLEVAPIEGFSFQSFAGEDPVKYYSFLSYETDEQRQAFYNSEAFGKYRDVVKPLFAAPPQMTPLQEIK